MPAVLHDIAWRAMQVHGALGMTNEMPFVMMMHGAVVMGLADGPTEVHKVTVARQVLRDYRPADGMWPTEWTAREAGGGPGQIRRVPRARGGQPVTPKSISRPTRSPPGWTTRGCRARARPSSTRFMSGGTPERDLRDPPWRPALRHAHPAADRARRPRRGHPAGVADHRGAGRHRRPAHRGHRGMRGHVGAGPTVLSDGLRRRLVADGHSPAWPAPVRHRPRGPARPGATS